jgi:dephospho-CoA kinase
VLKVGLTSGIGGGKTTVARIFEVLGIPVYYADDAARRLMNTNTSLRQSIISAFGEKAYKEDMLDRAYLASQVFGDKEKLELLNSLTHPATINDANEWMAKQQSAYIIKEAALIFESTSHKHLDYVIGVSSPIELRIERVMKRDQITREAVELRMARQMNEEEKMGRCNFIIYNNEQQSLIAQVLDLHKNFMRQAVSV